MSLPQNKDRMARFIHEHIHETTKDLLRDFVAVIIDKWETFKEEEGMTPLRFEIAKSIISDCICKTVNFCEGKKIPETALNLLVNEYTDKIMAEIAPLPIRPTFE